MTATALQTAFSPPLALNNVVSWGELALGGGILLTFLLFPRLVMLVMGKRRGRYFLRTLKASFSNDPGKGFQPDWWRNFESYEKAEAEADARATRRFGGGGPT